MITLAQLAQETMVAVNGGQMLTDDFPLSERQVRFLWATNIAARFGEKLDAYQAQNRPFPAEWRSRFVVSLSPLPASDDQLSLRLRYRTQLPGKVWDLIIRQASNSGVDDLIDGAAVDRVENALAAHAGRGFGSFASAKCVYSLHEQTLYVSTPNDEDYLNGLVVEGFIVPDVNFLTEQAHAPLVIPDGWLRDLRLDVQQQAAAILSTPTDPINDGAPSPAPNAR